MQIYVLKTQVSLPNSSQHPCYDQPALPWSSVNSAISFANEIVVMIARLEKLINGQMSVWRRGVIGWILRANRLLHLVP